MNSVQSAVMIVILAGIAAFLSLPGLVGRHPASMASLSLGTDDAFAVSGLQARENQIGGGALRWTGPRAAFRFEGVGPGPVEIDLEVRDHRTEVMITANGATIGTLLPGQRRFTSRTRLSSSSLLVGIETEGFATASRRLGTQFVSLRVQPAQAASTGSGQGPGRLWAALGGVVLVSFAVQVLVAQNVLIALVPPAVFLAMVLPAGLWRSAWLFECAVLLCVAIAISAAVASRARGSASARVSMELALFLALTLHAIVPPSPLVIQGDVQLHGNKLGEVARGNRFPTSRTDHKPPFEFPYGFSFYEVLTPFVSPEVSNVRVVREGAAFFSAAAAVGLALLLGRASASLGAASLILWACAPVNIRTMAFGNLSNVFAQAVFVLFLVVAGLAPRGKPRGLALIALAALSATAHLSSFIVLLTLLFSTLVIPKDRHDGAFRPLLAGVFLAGLYFATFVPMIVGQVPRLLSERGGSSGVFDPFRLPNQVVSGAGWPLVALIVLSMLVASIRPVLPLVRSLTVTGLLLGLIALVSPIEVRYLLALTPLLAIVGAAVFDEGDPRSFPGQRLASVVPLPWLRALGHEAVLLPLSFILLCAALLQGLCVLLDFVPLSRA
ncbi:MAG: hypothetical protein ABI565_05690 [Vicinamibacteria bacterium]